MPTSEPITAFDEFLENLDFARGLVKAGRALAAMRAGVVDVKDMYRAAWSQSVAGLDHWITREITERAVVLALNPDLPRPPRFSKLEIPVDAFERVYQGNGELGEVLRRCWGERFARSTHQRPAQIKEGLSHVVEGDLWRKVAEVMSATGPQVKPDQIRERLDEIIDRRNRIAHTADRNPAPPPARAELNDGDVVEVIDWLEKVAQAILTVLGDSVNPDDLTLKAATDGGGPALVPSGGQWDERSLLQGLENSAGPAYSTLLAVYRHAESHLAFRGYSFGTGAFPSVTASFRVGAAEASVWSIYADVDKPVLSINFEWMRGRGVATERLERLLRHLRQLPGAERVLSPVIGADYAKRPSLTPEMLAYGQDVVIDALNDLLAVDMEHEPAPADIDVPSAVTSVVEENLARARRPLAVLYDRLETQIQALGDDVVKKTRKLYIAFQRTQNFACIEVHPQANELLIFVKVDPDSIQLEEGFSRDMRNIGHFGTGDLELRVRSQKDLERAFPLIQQSYEAS
ncbi:DUF5655 domain-containing protein [Microbispora sp. H10670]|uniref:DUF5655 domain-containing protein n=1 Tax=Microbispora sp. H10670 TaxID=2729108 RepID=UPI0015FEBB3E|nr:DUF5655 domain-containing protein [Microbispora sp. H10670]